MDPTPSSIRVPLEPNSPPVSFDPPESVEKKIKQAVGAGVAVVCLTVLASVAGMFFDIGFGPSALFDAGLIGLLTYGVHRRSRACAVFLFLFYMAGKLLMVTETGGSSVGFLALIFLYYFGLGIVGTFQYHKLAKEAGVELPKSNLLLFGCLGVSGLCMVGFVALILFGFKIMKEDTTLALNQNPVSQQHVGTVQELSLDFMTTGEYDDEFIAYSVKGTNGSAVVRCNSPEAGEPLMGEMILPSGEVVSLQESVSEQGEQEESPEPESEPQAQAEPANK